MMASYSYSESKGLNPAFPDYQGDAMYWNRSGTDPNAQPTRTRLSSPTARTSSDLPATSGPDGFKVNGVSIIRPVAPTTVTL